MFRDHQSSPGGFQAAPAAGATANAEALVATRAADADGLRPHALQARALAALSTSLVGGARAVVVLPCGGGKTLLGRWLAEQLHARLVVVCVPSLALVPQTLLAYRSQTRSWAHTAMIVCSDPASGRAVALDDLTLPAWARNAVTASTSARLIGEFLTASTPGARLIVSTYHSAPRVAAALQRLQCRADLLVCDEAHRLTGQPREEFRTVLDGLPAARRVFLTATPVEAAAWAADARPDAPAPARAGASRILAFHTRVSHAKALAAALDGVVLPDGRMIRSEHLESRHRAGWRAAALDRLADTPADTVSVLASARVLTEGVDVPAVDTVVFADPRKSAVDIVQAVGRAMRQAPGKTRGRIVLAVTLERRDLDEDTALSSTAWRHVWVVLRALTAMDPRFARTLRGLSRRDKRPRGRRPHAGPSLRVQLPAELDLDRWILRALDRTGLGWWHNLAVLRDWAAKHGHAHPSSHVRHRNVHLGAWVARQRAMYRDGLLDDEQIAALEALPGWAWTALDTAWWQAWTRWLGFHTDGQRPLRDALTWEALAAAPGHDTHNVPRLTYATLAEFISDTCARRRRGLLPAHLERAADRLPGWRWDLLPAEDAAMVDALDEYAAWKNNLNPPHDYRHDDKLPLGAWLTAVRRRRVTGRLDPFLEHELLLLHKKHPTAVRLRWDTDGTRWRLAYLALRQFAAREGTCRVPYQHVETLPDYEVNLSRWCVVQRQEHRYHRLAAERVTALEQIPGWQWEVSLRDGYRPVLDDVDHGSRKAYAKGCRCDPCTDANASYEHSRENGTETTDLVDAAKARGVVRILRGRGASQKALARAAGLNVKTIAELEDGTLARIRPETAQAVLGLTLGVAKAAELPGRWTTVDAGPTWELLDDMLARGWPKAWISREIGKDGRALQLKRARVTVDNAAAVRDLHDRLGDRRPPNRARHAALPTLAEILAAERKAS